MNNVMYYFIIYKYVGETCKGRYHPKYYDWKFYETDNTRKALYRFWNEGDSNSCFSLRKEHKQDYQIIDVKVLDSIEREKFLLEYWNNMP